MQHVWFCTFLDLFPTLSVWIFMFHGILTLSFSTVTWGLWSYHGHSFCWHALGYNLGTTAYVSLSDFVVSPSFALLWRKALAVGDKVGNCCFTLSTKVGNIDYLFLNRSLCALSSLLQSRFSTNRSFFHFGLHFYWKCIAELLYEENEHIHDGADFFIGREESR